MSDNLEVDPEALRSHASNLLAVHDRFAAIQSASSTIGQSDDAYGQLCQFLPPIMDQRHDDQDEGVEAFAENIQLLSEAVNACADAYEEADSTASEDFSKLESEF